MFLKPTYTADDNLRLNLDPLLRFADHAVPVQRAQNGSVSVAIDSQIFRADVLGMISA